MKWDGVGREKHLYTLSNRHSEHTIEVSIVQWSAVETFHRMVGEMRFMEIEHPVETSRV